MFLPDGYGSLEVICGPMFSGKSEELIRRLRRAKIAKQNVLVFKPKIDNRYENEYVCSHDGNNIKAINITNSEEILEYIDAETDVIGIDEVQFLEGDIVSICRKLVKEGKRVICAGLDMDFRGEPFGLVPQLLAVADNITKLTAICMKCGKPAIFTQRLVDGKPAKYDDPLILIGAKESYEARCRKCHEI
ncbi:thymidine kinase [Defluviitalea phaphyphila]|uniref:thymidine kinase n=1 Tax=Defluviitalea phaphyphila TaxID=1473580 RepID=UPI000730E5DD|nr:thymidine kinase [Defluviitalea phaphyphila]